MIGVSYGARQTVVAPPVGLVTNGIFWNDADHAAYIGAPAVSPFKKGSGLDQEWIRTYNRAAYDLKLCGFTPCGRQKVYPK